MSMLFGEKILQGYIAVAIALLVVVTYRLLGGMNLESGSGGFIMISILILILVGAVLFNAIINLKVLEQLREEEEVLIKQDE